MKREIINIDEYINKNYKGAFLTSMKSLKLKTFTQRDLSSIENNCSITSITRIMNYYLNVDEKEIYDEVLEIARHHLFTETLGTFPNKIDDISREFLKKHGIKNKIRGIYLGNFYTHIKGEIDNLRPLMMNLAVGYYKNHSLVVSGYRIYNYNGMNIKIIEVIDGWRRNIRYIDYTDLRVKYILPLFSYNTFKIEKSN